MQIIPDGSAVSVRTSITDNLAPGSMVITDGWSGSWVSKRSIVHMTGAANA